MDIAGILFWVAIVGLAIYIVSIYNHLVRIKHNVSKAWSNIDVLLKQRHDEIPKLVEICKQYMKFEQETLEKVMQARAQVSEIRIRLRTGASFTMNQPISTLLVSRLSPT